MATDHFDDIMLLESYLLHFEFCEVLYPIWTPTLFLEAIHPIHGPE